MNSNQPPFPVPIPPPPPKKKKKIEKDKVGEFLKNKKIDKDGEIVLTRSLACLFGVSTDEILKWRRAGMPSVKTTSGLGFNTADCMKWRIVQEEKMVRDQLEPLIPADSMTYNQAKARKEVASALMAELNLAKEREQVANIDDLMFEFSNALLNVRAKLSSMSSRLSGSLSYQDDTTIGKLLDIEVKEMLEELSDYTN